MSDQKEKFLTDLTQDENIYLLGLLWADGYVGKKYDIRIEIKSSDFNYIIPLLNKYGFTKFSERIRHKNNKPFGSVQKIFTISNITLNEWMQKLGYREKSTISPSKVLSIIPREKHYLWWRGFFDGDGCFYCRGACHDFSVWGSIKQDWTELHTLYKLLELRNPRIKIYIRKGGKHCSSCVSITTSDDIKKLGEFIYKDRLDIGFSRKYETYKRCINSPTPLYEKKLSSKLGVYFSIWTGKWICRKTINHKRIIIGSYTEYDDACQAYDIY